MIQTILVLRRSGENICSQTYGDQKWNDTLTSGFISATFNFTQSTFGAEIQDMELGPYRVLFEMADDIILAAFFEKSDSIINVRKRLIKLKETMYSKYSNVLKKHLCSPDEFEGLSDIIEDLLKEYSDVGISDDLKESYMEIIEKFRSNEEILDCDLISSSGVPLTKEWNKDFLDLCLRMIDAFWKSRHYVLDQIILSYEERHLILHKISDQFILSALVRRNTPIGLATFLVDETSNMLSKLG